MIRSELVYLYMSFFVEPAAFYCDLHLLFFTKEPLEHFQDMDGMHPFRLAVPCRLGVCLFFRCTCVMLPAVQCSGRDLESLRKEPMHG